MAVGAVLFAGFAARFFGLGFGCTFAERRGLTLPGAKCLFELAGEFGDLGAECVHFFPESRAVGTNGIVHPGIVRGQVAFSCASFPQGALNKYQIRRVDTQTPVLSN